VPPLNKRASVFQREIRKYAEYNGIIVSRYVLCAGDGYAVENVWSWLDSFYAANTPLPRTTWFPVITDNVGTKHISQLFIPLSGVVQGGEPKVGQKLYLMTQNGTAIGNGFNIQFAVKLTNQEVYGYQVVVEEIQ